MRSPRWLVVVVLLHGCAPNVLTIEAERATVKTAGIAMTNGWNLHSNGRVGECLRVARAGTYGVTVRAYGSPARGAWPRMALLADGQHRGAVVVDQEQFADYSFRIELTEGVHEIAAAFTNDAVAGDEDRNLYLDRIEIHAPPRCPSPILVSPQELAMEAQKKEAQALAKATDDIERCRKGDAVVRVLGADGKAAAGASVVVDQTTHDFLFGCNIYGFDRLKTPQDNEAYKQRFAELFNYATTGFYWKGYEPVRGQPRYEYTDKVVAWCERKGIRLKGHPLLWDHSAGRPSWADDRQPPPQVQKQRVTEIVQRYSGKIDFWEVVNEPSHCRAVKIDDAYRWARDADAKAYLIVNDYHVMADGYRPFFELLQQAKADGVPFDGIGIQAHEPRTMRFPLDRVQRILDQYASLGKDLHITEFTPASGGRPITGSHLTGTWDEAAQAEYAVKFYTVCFAHRAVMAITWWDLCDQSSWLPGGGMLRKDLTAKPVYEALKKLIHEQWHTRASGEADADGRFRFRGLFGTYRLAATSNGTQATAEIHLAEGARNEFTVTLAER